MLLAGRGFGKTRTAAEWIRARVESGQAKRIALVGRTAADVRDTMVEGESGLLAISPPWSKPVYEPSKRRVTWPNGAVATTFSADEPNLLRGPQHDTAWADELAAWQYPDAWDQLNLGLRLGEPRVVVSTTPRPTPIIRGLVKDPASVITRGSTFENQGNLADSFLDEVRKRYEGTRLGRQELYAEVLDDTPGALWKYAQLDALRVQPGTHAELKRIVVAVDPSVTATETSDETGIVAVGLGVDAKGYVLRDESCKDSPDGWARRAVELYDRLQANAIVAEVNQGGDLVERIIKSAAKTMHERGLRPNAHVAYKAVRASKGKRARAEPVAALYEQEKVHHVGTHPKLEDQMTTWDASDGSPSPDRVDALVWALTELMVDAKVAPRGVVSTPLY